jgi:hypothetical protein
MALVKFPVGRDIFERLAKSFIQGAGAVAIAQGISLTTVVDLDFWKAIGVGGITAVLSLVTSVISLAIGKKGASADPAVGLAPEQTAV